MNKTDSVIVNLEHIKKANIIFAEHSMYKKEVVAYKQENDLLKQQLFLSSEVNKNLKEQIKILENQKVFKDNLIKAFDKERKKSKLKNNLVIGGLVISTSSLLILCLIK